MITKSFAAFAAAALLASISFTAGAQAGCGGNHGYRAANASYSPAYAAQVRAKKAAEARAIAAAKRKRQIEIAQAQAAKKARAVAAAKAKSQAVAVASKPATVKSTEKVEQVVTVAAVEVVENTCSKFIAATGTTVEVECSAE